jgi:hypothetical protein
MKDKIIKIATWVIVLLVSAIWAKSFVEVVKNVFLNNY